MDFTLFGMLHRKLLALLNNNDFTENTVGLAKLFEIANDFSIQHSIMINTHQLNHESHNYGSFTFVPKRTYCTGSMCNTT